MDEDVLALCVYMYRCGKWKVWKGWGNREDWRRMREEERVWGRLCG